MRGRLLRIWRRWQRTRIPARLLRRRCLLACALAALAACVLGGCSERQEEPAPLARGQYNVYYLNASMTELVSQVYETQETDPALLVEELMSQFLTVPAT